jgi:hypothetical protein
MILISLVRFIIYLLVGALMVVAAQATAYAPSRSVYTPNRAMFDEECSKSSKCIEERVKAEVPELYEAIRCESGFRQFDSKGNVLRSHTNDVGTFQINEKVWLEESKRLGHDIYQLRGNFEMAKHILKVQGKTAWVCFQIQNGMR